MRHRSPLAHTESLLQTQLASHQGTHNFSPDRPVPKLHLDLSGSIAFQTVILSVTLIDRFLLMAALATKNEERGIERDMRRAMAARRLCLLLFIYLSISGPAHLGSRKGEEAPSSLAFGNELL